jgi:hypothetical protein
MLTQFLHESKDEQRTIPREVFYRSERLKVILKVGESRLEACIVDFSPMGIGLALSRPEDARRLTAQENVQIAFPSLAWGAEAEGHIVSIRQLEWQGELVMHVGIMLRASSSLPEISEQRRQRERFLIPLANSLGITSHDPLHRNQQLQFDLMNFSSDGMMLRARLQKSFVFKNRVLLLHFQFPSQGSFFQMVEIRYLVPELDHIHFHVGVRFFEPNPQFLSALGEYALLQNQTLSFRHLSSQGFPISLSGLPFDVGPTRDPEDLRQIIQLRRLAYGEAGTLGYRLDDPLEKFTDSYDAYARHYVAKLGNRVVACGRCVFVGRDVQKSEFLPHVPHYPNWLVGKNLVEVSRMCTHPDFRRGPLLMRLSSEMVRGAWLAGAEHMVTVARESMLPTYETFGMKRYGDWFPFRGNTMMFLHASPQDMISGKSVGLLPWILIVPPLIETLPSDAKASLGLAVRLKSKIFSHFTPNVERLLVARNQKRRAERKTG